MNFQVKIIKNTRFFCSLN